jgi:hypothetical protein
LSSASPSGESPGRGALAYISHYFPALTQTFVYREIQALEELGWTVKPFSIRRPTKGISGDARELAARTTYLIPLPPLRFPARVLGLILRRPLRSAGILARLLLAPGETLRARLHGLTHFFGGLHLAPEIARSGARHIHAHFGMNPATLAMVAAEYLGIPFSMTIHARDLFVDTALLRTKLRRARFVVTISEYNRRILRDLAGAPDAERIHVLHCGVNVAKLTPRNGKAPVARGSPAPVFLAVGRHGPKNG